MMILSFGLFVGYCYDFDYRLIDDIGVSVFTIIFWSITLDIMLPLDY